MPRRRSNTFGSSLNRWLSEADLSQSGLARSTGTSIAYTNQLIRGRKRPSPEWIDLVAKTLKLSERKRVELHRAAARDLGFDLDLSPRGNKS
jgi:hypothetical protein